jgi:hypothetical protein
MWASDVVFLHHVLRASAHNVRHGYQMSKVALLLWHYQRTICHLVQRKSFPPDPALPEVVLAGKLQVTRGIDDGGRPTPATRHQSIEQIDRPEDSPSFFLFSIGDVLGRIEHQLAILCNPNGYSNFDPR